MRHPHAHNIERRDLFSRTNAINQSVRTGTTVGDFHGMSATGFGPERAGKSAISRLGDTRNAMFNSITGEEL